MWINFTPGSSIVMRLGPLCGHCRSMTKRLFNTGKISKISIINQDKSCKHLSSRIRSRIAKESSGCPVSVTCRGALFFKEFKVLHDFRGFFLWALNCFVVVACAGAVFYKKFVLPCVFSIDFEG